VGVTWPLALLALLVLPLLVAAYVRQLRRRRRQAVRYSSVALIRAAAPRRSAWRRHVAFALLLAALAALGLAAARPHLRATVPVSQSSVILALDVSGSMCATDVDPNRLTAAQAAMRTFVEDQDAETRIGLVLFSGFAQVAVAPTADRQPLLTAIDTLTTGRGTTIGAAILKSVDAIAEINPDVAPADGPASAARPRAPGTFAP
jgi:Ca-activated chloride channel homolog